MVFLAEPPAAQGEKASLHDPKRLVRAHGAKGPPGAYRGKIPPMEPIAGVLFPSLHSLTPCGLPCLIMGPASEQFRCIFIGSITIMKVIEPENLLDL